MTELQMFLQFLIAISGQYNVKRDIVRVQNFLQYIYINRDDKAFEAFLSALMALDDAIVSGLNTGHFRWERTDVFSLYPHSSLPKFFRGVLSKFFAEDGLLLERDYSPDDLAVIEGIRLVRRTQFPSLETKAAQKAEEKFISQQRETRLTSPEVLQDLKQAWAYFAPESLFRKSLVLGFPGPGVMQKMRFPHLPQLTFADHNTITCPITAGIMSDALCLKLQSFAFSHGYPDSNLVQVYPFIKGPRIADLAIVPKTALIGRAITVTDPVSVCIGATIRDTLFAVAHEDWGLRSYLNVHDQSLSHRTLTEDFHTTSYLDLEGGSSCLTTATLDTVLPAYIVAMWKASRPGFVRMSNGLDHPLHTLTMGDSSSVALLTITLGLAIAIGVHRTLTPGRKLTRDTFAYVINYIRDDSRFHVVGDDMVFPSVFEQEIRVVLAGLGVSINERKSSTMTSRHKETCGAWCIKGPDGVIASIYPFRAPDKRNSMNIRAQSTQAFLRRCSKSNFALDLCLSVTSGLPFEENLQRYESFDLSCVGSQFGVEPPKFKYHQFDGDSVELPDELSYVFGIEPNRCFPRYSRRPLIPKVGYSALKDAHPMPFVSYSKCKAKCSKLQVQTSHKKVRQTRSDIRPRLSDHLEFILSFMYVNRLVVLFA